MYPKLRFKGFDDAWEQRKLNELAEFNPKCNLPNSFEYVDLESVVGTEMISSRYEIKENAPSRAQRLAKKGDVFYQTVRPYQRNNYLFDKEENNYVFSTGYAQLRPNCNSRYLLNLLQTDSFVNIVLNNCTGTSYPAINSSDLGNIHVTTTKNIREQTKIGEIFYRLDNLITLHQRQCEALKKQKQFFLQNMFPKEGESEPRIRFNGFTEPWEQRKLGEISALITKGTTPKDKSGLGEVNFVKVESIDPSLGKITCSSKISATEHNNYLKRSQLKDKDILFSIAGTLGRVGIVNRDILPANTNQALAIIRLNKGNVSYVSTYLKGKAVENFIRKNPTVGAQPNLSLEQVSNLIIDYPSSQEQVKIGSYFEHLDNLITLHQQLYEQLVSLKKYLLSKMFI